jgi:hypothetical protein
MILDILRLLAFENMDVQIKKFHDCICIRNKKTEFVTKYGKAMFKVTSIDTEINLDGELLSSRISYAFLPNQTIKPIPWIYDKYPSYNYFNKVPLRCSEAIQKSMEVCSCDIPKLALGDCINIDRFGGIKLIRLCDRKEY